MVNSKMRRTNMGMQSRIGRTTYGTYTGVEVSLGASE